MATMMSSSAIPLIVHRARASGRGLDGHWGMYQWLDSVPLPRNENGMWCRRHDEYGDGRSGRPSHANLAYFAGNDPRG